MELKELQELKSEFEKSRGWDRFPASQVFVHLIEELGEISRFISIEEGYKPEGIGHEAPSVANLSREFAQSFSLFVQLANHFKIDLESAVIEELKIMDSRFPADKWREYMSRK